MPRRKRPHIPDEPLNQLLAGANVKTAFDANGLLDRLAAGIFCNRAPCTITSARAARLISLADHPVAKRSIWLVEAARRSTPPIHHSAHRRVMREAVGVVKAGETAEQQTGATGRSADGACSCRDGIPTMSRHLVIEMNRRY
jgi:hypothetical protein